MCPTLLMAFYSEFCILSNHIFSTEYANEKGIPDCVGVNNALP